MSCPQPNFAGVEWVLHGAGFRDPSIYIYSVLGQDELVFGTTDFAFISYEQVKLYFTSVCILLFLCTRILHFFFRLEEESLTPQGEATTLACGSHSLHRLVP